VSKMGPALLPASGMSPSLTETRGEPQLHHRYLGRRVVYRLVKMLAVRGRGRGYEREKDLEPVWLVEWVGRIKRILPQMRCKSGIT